MNMLDGAAVNEVAGLATKAAGNHQPVLIDGIPFTTQTNALQRVATPIATPRALEVTTLAALCDFVRQNDFGGTRESALPNRYLHVVSPTEVRLISQLVGPEMQRHTYAVAKPMLPEGLEKSYTPEAFVIALQSRCVVSVDRDYLIGLASGVRAESGVTMADDGVSQQVTVKSGITFVGAVAIRNPLQLAPYRTFAEVEQPASTFIVRAKQVPGDQPVAFTLFEADGGAWRLEAIRNVKDWLDAQMLGIPVLA